MILIFLIIMTIIILYSLYSYIRLKSKNQQVEISRTELNKVLDKRFSILENFINLSDSIFNYEQTILKEAVQLRIQAQIDKQKGQNKKQLQAEQQISLIIKQMEVLFTEYPKLKTLSVNFIEEFKLKEIEIELAKKILMEKMNDYFYERERIPHKFICSLLKDNFNKNSPQPVQYWKM